MSTPDDFHIIRPSTASHNGIKAYRANQQDDKKIIYGHGHFESQNQSDFPNCSL